MMRQILMLFLVLTSAFAYAGMPNQNTKVLTKTDSLAFDIREVTVTSIRANQQSAVTFSDIKSAEIEKRNLGQDIPYLLSLTPSFITTSDAGTGVGYTGFRVRGTDANRVNITVNGVPLNDPESHGVFFVNMPDFASSLSSVQVQRGVGTSTNGAAAFGASINMQTEGLQTKPYAEVNSSFGSYNTNKNTLKAGTGLLNDHWAFDARLSNVTSDGYIQRAWVDMKSYYFSGGYFNGNTALKFITFGGKEKTYQAWNGVSAENLATDRTYNELGKYTDVNGNTQYYSDQTDNYNQTHYQLHLNQVFTPELYLNATAHYTRGKGYYEEYKSDRYYDEYSMIPAVVDGETLYTTDLVRRKWLDNHFGGLTFALNYDKENVKASLGGGLNRYDGEHYGQVLWARYANNLDPEHAYYLSHSVKDDANIYAKTVVTLLGQLYATADLQYRYIHHTMNGENDKFDWNNMTMRPLDIDKTFHFFNPKIGLTWKINQSSDMYGSFSIANREPTRNNFTEAGINEKPVSERLYDTELGYRFVSSRFSASANAYYMKYKNQLVLTGKVSEIGELLTSNMPDSYRAGFELIAGVKITDNLKWDGNVSLSQNKILNYQDVAYVWDADWSISDEVITSFESTDIAYSPNIVANSIFTWQIKQFEVGFNSVYVGKQYLDNTSSNDRAIDAYFVNNLILKYSVPVKKLKALDFQLMINNLFNETYETNGYAWSEYYEGDDTRYSYKYLFPQAPTRFLASVTLKF